MLVMPSAHTCIPGGQAFALSGTQRSNLAKCGSWVDSRVFAEQTKCKSKSKSKRLPNFSFERLALALGLLRKHPGVRQSLTIYTPVVPLVKNEVPGSPDST
jgi:hypothetical protein